MIINANIEVNNVPGRDIAEGYLVATNDNGRLWFYGLYASKERAEEAVNEFPETRFMVEVVNG